MKNVRASFVTFVKLMLFMFIFNSLISEKFSYFNTESRYEDVRPTSSTYEQIIETDDQYTSLGGPESLQDDDGEILAASNYTLKWRRTWRHSDTRWSQFFLTLTCWKRHFVPKKKNPKHILYLNLFNNRSLKWKALEFSLNGFTELTEFAEFSDKKNPKKSKMSTVGAGTQDLLCKRQRWYH